jgi:hypothetical protein
MTDRSVKWCFLAKAKQSFKLSTLPDFNGLSWLRSWAHFHSIRGAGNTGIFVFKEETNFPNVCHIGQNPNLHSNSGFVDIAANFQQHAGKYYESLIEASADYDDQLADMIGATLRKATLLTDFVGVTPGSDVQKNGRVKSRPNDSEKMTASGTKLMSDPDAGKLIFSCVSSGHLQTSDAISNPRTRQTERVSRLMIMNAADRQDIGLAYSGDI